MYLKNAPARRHLEFKVVAVSKTANSFGLKGHVLMKRDGTAYEVGRSIAAPNPWKQGQIVQVPCLKLANGWSPVWAPLGCEIPRVLKQAPPEVVKEVWGDIPPLPPQAADYTNRCLAE